MTEPTKKSPTPHARWYEAGEVDPHLGKIPEAREDLILGHFTEDELGNHAFMHYNSPLNLEGIIAGTHHSPIAIMTAVKERLRWCARQLIKKDEKIAELEAKLANIKTDYVGLESVVASNQKLERKARIKSREKYLTWNNDEERADVFYRFARDPEFHLQWAPVLQSVLSRALRDDTSLLTPVKSVGDWFVLMADVSSKVDRLLVKGLTVRDIIAECLRNGNAISKYALVDDLEFYVKCMKDVRHPIADVFEIAKIQAKEGTSE